MKNFKSCNIVIVDDEDIVTSSIKSLLRLEGYSNANFFNSPEEALEYIKITRVDLIISDFYMPKMNGIEFLEKAKELNPGITTILLTGYADKESAIKAINRIGLYRYIEKPWDNEDLLLSIKTGLERSHLLENLEQKINELEEIKSRLEITVQERTQDLSKANYKLSAVINHSADGIITISQDGRIINANPAFSLICGIANPEDIDISDICIKNSEEKIHHLLNKEKDFLIKDYRIKNFTTNKLTPVEINFAPIKQSISGEETLFVGVIRDTTAQYELDKLRDDFIATLTHDLRTPLLAAIQTLQFFLDGTLGELGEKQKILLDTMKQSNEDMLGLVNALLEVYKYESGQLILYRENFVLSDIIKNCVKEIMPLAQSREISINCQNLTDEKIYADKHELKRVILNFLGNAIKHTNKGGNVDISIELEEQTVTLCVSDNGIGIPADDIPRLFNRFSQGTGKKRSTSTGLGLYLSRQIIEAHKGKIWVESELNQGSKFKFTIPKETIETNLEKKKEEIKWQ